VLIVQTFIIGYQTAIFHRQTKILEKQTILSESVALSIVPDPHIPITGATGNNKLRISVRNEGKGTALAPQIDGYIVDPATSAPVASGSSVMQPIGPSSARDIIIDLAGSAIPPNPHLKCYWKATGSGGNSYSGSQESDL
jgi:hypothetical protein